MPGGAARRALRDTPPVQVAVVGAGISGAACARAAAAAGHDVHVLDRGRAAGGRMASRTLQGRVVDLGAAYFTATDERFAAVVDDWTQRGLARPWTTSFATASGTALGPDRPPGAQRGPLRWRAPAGLRGLVQDLATGLDVRQGCEVGHVGPGPVVDGEPYDAVVLAMPDPQALRLLDPSEAGLRAELAQRPWEPVLAVVAGFPERTWHLDGCFVNDSGVLAFVADDGGRRGDGAPVLVAHTAAPLAARSLADPERAVPEVVAALRALLDLPAPRWTAVQRWTYARPARPHAAPYALSGGIGVCGDGWAEALTGGPKVETAWLSGTLLGQALSAPR